eukprot:12774085-Alexandrium_andersonii.AAC.1
MSASLVGSEMCIRDRWLPDETTRPRGANRGGAEKGVRGGRHTHVQSGPCLLYTSDAADDM